MRIQIYHWLITLGRSPQETKDANICLREVSIRRLVCLSFYLRRNSFRLAYLDGPQWKSGRKRILSCEALEIIKDMACAKKKFILSNLKSEFDLFYFNQLALYPDQSGSRTTFFRAMQRGGISRKVMERRHMFCDDVKGLEYVEFMAMYDPSLVVDIDEMKQTPEGSVNKAQNITFPTRLGNRHVWDSNWQSATLCGSLLTDTIGNNSSKGVVQGSKTSEVNTIIFIKLPIASTCT